MKARLASVVGFALVALSVFAHDARAQWCPFVGAWEQGVSRIPIYVSLDGGAFEGNPTEEEIARSVKVTAAQFAEHVNANIDFFYAGLMQNYAGSIAGAVVVHSSAVYPANTFPFDMDHNGRIDRCNIFLAYTRPGLTYTLIHELEHCLGLHHAIECTNEQALVENVNTSGGGFRAYDVRNLEALYGLRNQQSGFVRQFDANFQTWSSVTEAPTSGWETARGGVATCNSFALGGGRMAFSKDGAIYYGQVGSTAFTRVDTTPAGGQVAMQRPSIACGNDGSFLVSWVAQPMLSTSVQVHRLIQSSGYSDIVIPATNPIFLGDSLAATFDPVSGKYLVAYTAFHQSTSTDAIYVYVHGGPSLLRALYQNAAPIPTAGRPSIACGTVALVGSNNCLVAWVDGRWRATVKYAFGRVGEAFPGETSFLLDQSTVTDSGIAIIGDPAVAFSGRPTEPWLMSAMLNDTTLRVWTRGGAAGWTAKSDWVISVGFSFVSPALMTYQYQTCLPFWGCTTWDAWRAYGRTFRH